MLSLWPTGYPIADKANSGYSENAPYTGRDPRLEKYILFNGAEFKDKTIITRSLS